MRDYIVSTFAGSPGVPGNENNTGEAARFRDPQGLAADSLGNLYVADFTNNAIRKITPTGVVTTFAGSTTGQAGCINGTGTEARFNGPYDILINSNVLYVTDFANHVVRKITLAGVVTTLTGLSGNPGTANGNNAIAQFNGPAGIAAIGSTLYVADSNNHSIRSILTTGTTAGTVATYAGSNGTSGNNAASTGTITRENARFNLPIGIATRGGAGSILYVTDTGNHTIRGITTSQVTVIAGTAGSRGAFNGTKDQASFRVPVGIAVDSSGEIYVTDFNHVIRKIYEPNQALNPNRQVINFAGFPGQVGTENGVTSVARFNTPVGIAIINTGPNAGVIYVADSSNHTIRKLTPIMTPVPLLSFQALLRRPRRVYNLRINSIVRESYNKYDTNNDGSISLTLFFDSNQTSTQVVTMTMNGSAQATTVGSSVTFGGLDEHGGNMTIVVTVGEFTSYLTLSLASSIITFNGTAYGAGALIPLVNLE